MFSTSMTIKDFDPELQAAIEGERQRQEEHIELIASENYTSPRVMEAQGSVLTNKYAEGYPAAFRFPGQCRRLHGPAEAGRHRAGHEPGARWSSDAWCQC